MRNFLEPFARFGNFFFFVLLEIICFVLIISFNQSQNNTFFYSANLFSGYLLKKYDNATGYIHLRESADSLSRENAILLERIHEIKDDSPMVQDTVLGDTTKVKFQMIAAKVINNSVVKNNNYLTIDRGRKDGIQAHLGVFADNGLVGIVRNVSNNYARVMSLLHRQTRISAAIKSTNYFGTLSWKGLDPDVLVLDDIPKHAQLSIGDTIVTSGYSSIFPPDLMIGTIKDFEVFSGSNSYTVRVRVGKRLSNIEYVYVARNLEFEELIKLEEEVDNE